MNVKIFGPNLRDQSKGQFHVHAAECGDCKHYGPEGKFGGEGGEHDEPVVFVETAAGCCEYVYGDIVTSDYGYQPGSAEYDDLIDAWISDFWFAPCVKELH